MYWTYSLYRKMCPQRLGPVLMAEGHIEGHDWDMAESMWFDMACGLAGYANA